MPAHTLPVRDGPVDELCGGGGVALATHRLCLAPFHEVLVCGAAHVVLHDQAGFPVAIFVEFLVFGGRAEVEFSDAFEEGVDAGGGLAGGEEGGGFG